MAETDNNQEINNKAPEILRETAKQLERENEALRSQLWKYKRKPAGNIGYLLLFFGFIALVWSVLYSSYVPAFIGIALLFWGALVLFIRPVKYIKAELLSSTALSTFTAVNTIIENLGYKGKGIYLPPKYFKESRTVKLLISAQENMTIPTQEEISEEAVFFKNPQQICLTPSGLDLANLFEDELGMDFIETDFNYLQKNLPKLFIEGLEIAEDFKMSLRPNMIRIRILNSIYKDLCLAARKLANTSCTSFACPLCSSIACVLSRVSGKPVTIQRSRVSSDGEKMEVFYQILEE